MVCADYTIPPATICTTFVPRLLSYPHDQQTYKELLTSSYSRGTSGTDAMEETWQRQPRMSRYLAYVVNVLSNCWCRCFHLVRQVHLIIIVNNQGMLPNAQPCFKVHTFVDHHTFCVLNFFLLSICWNLCNVALAISLLIQNQPNLSRVMTKLWKAYYKCIITDISKDPYSLLTFFIVQ